MSKEKALPRWFIPHDLLPTDLEELDDLPIRAIHGKILALTRTRGKSYGEFTEKYGTGSMLGVHSSINPTLIPDPAKPYLIPENPDVATGSLYDMRVQVLWGHNWSIWRPGEVLFFSTNPIEAEVNGVPVDSQLKVVRYLLDLNGARFDDTYMVLGNTPGEETFVPADQPTQWHSGILQSELRAINTAINMTWLSGEILIDAVEAQ